MNEVGQLLRRIGSRDSLSWASFWGVFVVNFSITLEANSFRWDAYGVAQIGIIIASQFVLYLPSVLLWFTLRNGGRRPILMGLAFAAGSQLRTAVIVAGFSMLPGPFDPNYVFRSASSLLLFGGMMMVFAVFTESIRQIRRNEHRLEVARSRIRSLEQDVLARMSHQHAETLDRIRGLIDRALNKSRAAEIATDLRSSLDEVIRPLSRQLASSIPEVPTDPYDSDSGAQLNFVQLIRAAATRPVFAPFLQASVFMITITPFAVETGTLAYTLAVLPLGWGLISSVLWLVNQTIGYSLHQHAETLSPVRLVLEYGVRLVIGAGAVSAATIGIGVVGEFEDSESYIWTTVMFHVSFAVLYLFTRAATLIAARHDSDVTEVLQALDWEVTRVQGVAWEQQRRFALALHGPLQGALMALLYRFEEQHTDSDTRELRDIARQELMNVLNDVSSPENRVEDFESVIDQLRTLWEGIAEIQLALTSEARTVLADDVTCRAIAIDVVREAVSNAIRHGKADAIVLLVIAEEGSLELRVRNNGAEQDGQVSERGLGSSFMDEVCLSWSLEHKGSATVLTARIPWSGG